MIGVICLTENEGRLGERDKSESLHQHRRAWRWMGQDKGGTMRVGGRMRIK